MRRSVDEATIQPLRSRAEAEVATALSELAWRLAASTGGSRCSADGQEL